MNSEKLREEIEIELDYMKQTISEIHLLLPSIKGEEPTNVEKTAAGAFISQIYSGIEKILLRICKYRGVKIPTGQNWHVELLKKFCDPPQNNLPLLIDKDLEEILTPFRKFRHYFLHGYAIQIDTKLLIPGLVNSDKVHTKFADNVKQFLSSA